MTHLVQERQADSGIDPTTPRDIWDVFLVYVLAMETDFAVVCSQLFPSS
jgi:hypothetical protein